MDAQGVFVQAAGRCLMRPGAQSAVQAPARDAWRRTYTEAGRPVLLDPEEGQSFVRIWQRHLLSKMRSVCQRTIKPELFFAVRLLLPEHLEHLGWHSWETARPRPLPIVRQVRRTATDAALLFGRRPHAGYSLPYGGSILKGELERFGKSFLTLLTLSEAHLVSWLHNVAFGLGIEFDVSEQGFSPACGNLEKILAASRDERVHHYYSPFTRIGEFYASAQFMLDPHELGAATTGLVSSRYEPDSTGRPGYRFGNWPLDHLRDFLYEDLDAEVASMALGVDPRGFVGLLGGLCLLARDRLGEPAELEAAHASSVLPFEVDQLEGEGLLGSGYRYLGEADTDPDTVDLGAARDHFLYLSGSIGKGPEDPPFLQTSVGNTRYSYLLHRFGRTYVLDTMHADHWLHRILDLIASRTGRGAQASLKGDRVEDQVWDFFGGSASVGRVDALRNYVVERKKGQDDDDLDVPLRVGSTLVLAETKGHRLHYETEAVDRRFLHERWKNICDYLDKADRTARRVAGMHDHEDLREALVGVERILPVLCRPYPEWIPNEDRRLWLRPPARGARGVPRILTPLELKEFLESTTDEEIASLPGGYVVSLSDR